MDNKIKWATELIEEKMKLEDEKQKVSIESQIRLKKHSSAMPPEVVQLDIPHLEEEKKHGPVKKDIASLKTGPVLVEDFLKAAVQGRIQVVEKFLADGGSPNVCDEFHRTALHRASLEGYTEIVEKLLDQGATIDFRDRLDCTAMHWACRGGHLAVVKLLQEKGANLKLKDKLLSTPLHVATRTGVAEVVEHLINNGVDVNSRDREGDSALHDAVRLNRYKIIKMLILHGGDMLAKNLAGKTPADLVQLWQADTREVLEKKKPNTTEMPT
ncbi:PREDICTED: ankyrin repeat domain-containing protein 2 [Thamnophis sirtalis]|uniref:Ankyrin repeat domain-containing protein 2 n=1 Tax=Thamnophis sirtalis TaxID=35019 RepID=A0A6I9YCW7_9SAUR|nr:PREDICTED: ankyrin repeat domain-containing protein 2 [Thamnophis sirtalis]